MPRLEVRKIKTKNKFVLSAIAVALVGVTAFAPTPINAQGSYPPVVQMLVDKFHLNTGDVQSVFDQAKQNRQDKRQDNIKSRLDQAVKDGKITADQEQKILNKLNELRAGRQAEIDKLKGMTPQQRRDEMKKERQDLQNWAKDNGISPKFIPLSFRMHGMWMGK